jgi:ATP-dependent Clp protease ATP-binding subunit ClpA
VGGSSWLWRMRRGKKLHTRALAPPLRPRTNAQHTNAQHTHAHPFPAGHNYIGTEHILLGLLREGEGVAARVLETLGADPAKIRTQASGGEWQPPG